MVWAFVPASWSPHASLRLQGGTLCGAALAVGLGLVTAQFPVVLLGAGILGVQRAVASLNALPHQPHLQRHRIASPAALQFAGLLLLLASGSDQPLGVLVGGMLLVGILGIIVLLRPDGMQSSPASTRKKP